MRPPCRYESPVVVAPELTKKSPSTVEEAVEIRPANVERPPTARVEEAPIAPCTSSVEVNVLEAEEMIPPLKLKSPVVVASPVTRKSPFTVEEALAMKPWSKNQEFAVEEAERYVVPPRAVKMTLGSVALPCESDPHRSIPLVSVSMVSQSVRLVTAKPFVVVAPPLI